MTAFVVAACGGGNAGDDAGTMGGAEAETGTPGMTADTLPGGAMDTALIDTATAGTDTTIP